MDNNQLQLIVQDFEDALLQFDKDKAIKTILKYKEIGDKEIFDNLIIGALKTIGDKWERGNVALAQVYMSGRICEELVESFIEIRKAPKRNHLLTGIATIGDHHLLGKKIVYSMLTSVGYQIIDYGNGLGVDELVEHIQQDNLKIILISALMYPTALKVKDLRKKLKSNANETKIVVGGAPFYLDQELWKEVGADAMGKTSTDAIKIIDQFSKQEF